MRGINRQIIFEVNEDKEKFLEILKKYKEVSQYEIYAYCIMDNHVHQHIGIQSIEELRKLDKKKIDTALRQLKGVEGLSIRQMARITGFTVNIVAKA